MKNNVNIFYPSSALLACLAVICLLVLLYQWNSERLAILRLRKQIDFIENVHFSNGHSNQNSHKGPINWLRNMPLQMQRLEIHRRMIIVDWKGHFEQLIGWLKKYDRQANHYCIRQMTITAQSRSGALNIEARLVRD